MTGFIDIEPEMRDEWFTPAGWEEIPGGKSRPSQTFPADKVAEGMRVEMEHTDDPALAEEIARDHLAEDLDYYDKLKKVERYNLQTGLQIERTRKKKSEPEDDHETSDECYEAIADEIERFERERPKADAAEITLCSRDGSQSVRVKIGEAVVTAEPESTRPAEPTLITEPAFPTGGQVDAGGVRDGVDLASPKLPPRVKKRKVTIDGRDDDGAMTGFVEEFEYEE